MTDVKHLEQTIVDRTQGRSRAWLLFVVTALAFSLSSCVTAGVPSDGDGLLQTFDRMGEMREWNDSEAATKAALKLIPLGTPEQRATDALVRAGFPEPTRQTRSYNDVRCPEPQPYMTAGPCPDPKNKSDYYLEFVHTRRTGYFSTLPPRIHYLVEVGVRAGRVDFLFAELYIDPVL